MEGRLRPWYDRCSQLGAMNVSLYQAASALNTSSRWQDVVSENLAASSVPGYKRRELQLEAMQSGMTSWGTGAGAESSTPFILPRAAVVTNFAPGEMQRTGVNTNAAIDGPAFFEVQLPDGTLGYTRDGEFQLDAQGQLVTKQGFPVLGDGGPIQFDTSLGNVVESISIAPNGEISQGAESRGRLKLVEFSDPNRLTPALGGFYLAKDPALEPQAAAQSTLRQQWIEGANTSPMLEMSSLMAALRSFEANQKVIQLQDERMGKVINELSPV